jgi:hypothetical protein
MAMKIEYYRVWLCCDYCGQHFKASIEDLPADFDARAASAICVPCGARYAGLLIAGRDADRQAFVEKCAASVIRRLRQLN